MIRRTTRLAVGIALASFAASAAAHAQGRGGAAPPPAARASAPIDLTGYWVAFISEEWRYRMLMPPKGDYRGIPLTPEGTRVANTWDPAAAEPEPCKAYGAPAIMRIPGRFHIVWQDDNTLRLDTDAGTQTRLFRFNPAAAPGPATWQGSSTARWERAGRGAGSLTVVTTNVRPGYLRRNGVPYSENATVTEYFDVAAHPAGGQVLIVTTVVEDPRYLQRPYIVSSHFKKEGDGAKWDPSPCTAAW
ncbi:MAG TPA: hypothetical protein VN654_12785 [Vicinamibacterales bacterium]|jgi:hypothetical protein|nr:hypothetical protein [Vicinamibacterales bacterium]